MSADDKKKLDGVEAEANAYTHPTGSGNKHIPMGGSSGQILKWSADGTAAWGEDTKYTAATANPKANGTAAVGSSEKYAREDHVHPLQTSVARLTTARNINNVAFDGRLLWLLNYSEHNIFH